MRLCGALPPVVQYMCCQPCWILAVTMQYIAVGEAIYVCQLCSIFAGCAVYVLSAVLDIGGDNAMNCYRQGLCASVNCAAYCRRYAVYVLSAVLDIGGDNAIYRRRRGLCASVNCAAYCRRCAVYVLSAVLDIGSDNTMNCYRRGYIRLPTMQYIRRSCRIFAVSCA